MLDTKKQNDLPTVSSQTQKGARSLLSALHKTPGANTLCSCQAQPQPPYRSTQPPTLHPLQDSTYNERLHSSCIKDYGCTSSRRVERSSTYLPTIHRGQDQGDQSPSACPALAKGDDIEKTPYKPSERPTLILFVNFVKPIKGVLKLHICPQPSAEQLRHVRHYGMTMKNADWKVWIFEPTLTEWKWVGCQVRYLDGRSLKTTAGVRRLIP
jgi:hypothetical protein